jgi:DNA-binding PadR family transcriptional regulator
MQKEGFISLAENDGRRKTYQITPEGEQALRMEYGLLKALIADSKILEEGDDLE